MTRAAKRRVVIVRKFGVIQCRCRGLGRAARPRRVAEQALVAPGVIRRDARERFYAPLTMLDF